MRLPHPNADSSNDPQQSRFAGHSEHYRWHKSPYTGLHLVRPPLIYTNPRITGLVVLGGHTKVPPTNNFKNAFEGTTSSGFFLANALVNITYSYMGWENAFNVLAEVKDPIRTVRRAAPLTLALITILYILCNVAYFATSTFKYLEN